MTETDLMHHIMIAVSYRGNMVFRTNVGKIRLPNGRMFSTGLPKGHPDLYGYRPDGQIFYLEVKVKPNKPTPEQVRFIESAKKHGALAGVVYSVEEALDVVGAVIEAGKRPDED